MERLFKSKVDSGEVFEFTLKKHNQINGKHSFIVKSPECEEIFEFRVVDFDDKYVRIDMMENHNRPEYKMKGIAEYLIPTVAKYLNKKVLSSIQDGRPSKAEWRTLYAEKFWEKMEGKKKAIYHHETDRYEFTSEETLD